MNANQLNLADPGLMATDAALPFLRHLQREDPVHWNSLPGGDGFWVLTRHHHAMQVFRRRGSFTSEYGIQVGQAESFNIPAAGKMMVMSDGPSHTRLKALFGKGLSPAALRDTLELVRESARGFVGDFVAAGGGDAVTTISQPMSFNVLATLLGIPGAEYEQLRRYTDIVFGGSEPGETPAAEANASLFSMLASHLTQPNPTGYIGTLTHASRAGRLSTEELLLNAHLLLAGGLETTQHALSGAVLAFSEHPDQFMRLRGAPSLLPTAVEEILRWYPPSLNIMRTALTDQFIGGQAIAAGQRVTLWNPVINRDPEAFHAPDTFDVARNPNRHLTFGAGTHFCLGSGLAKMQLEAVVEAMCRTQARWSLTGPPQRVRSTRVWGIAHLPIAIL